MERAISNTIFYFDTKGALNQMFPNLLSRSYKKIPMLNSVFCRGWRELQPFLEQEPKLNICYVYTVQSTTLNPNYH